MEAFDPVAPKVHNQVVLKSTMRITYYCHLRKAYFTRIVKVDPDLEVQRKLSTCVLKTTPDEGNATAYVGIALLKVDGKFCGTKSCISASVPGYLFGPEYYGAWRKDSNILWDLRKSAFIPRK